MRNHPLLALLSVSLSFSVLSVAHASSGVTIDQPKVLYKLQPGQSVTNVVNVLNPGFSGENLEIKVVQNDWLLSPQGEPQYLSPGTLKQSLARWLTLPANTFALGGQNQRDVRYTLQVPPGTAPGLYWGVLFFNSQAQPNANVPKNGVALQYTVNVGHIIYVEVGEVKTDGRISSLKAGFDKDKLTVTAALRNQGSTYLGVQGKVEVRDAKGVMVAQGEVPSSLILPGYSRSFDTVIDKVLTPGKYLVLTALEYQKGKFYTGETTLEVK